jgi:putative tryptophan/tyrosine transport system substrate-binding protein
VEWYSSAGDAERVSQLARQVAANKPDIIFSPDTQMARVLKATTSTIPIVVIADDPVLQGLAVSLSRPGTNITGFSIGASLELIAKRLELLKEAVPAVSRIAWLISTRVWQGLTERACREAAEIAGLALIPAVLASPVDASEFRRVFAAIAQDRVDSLYVAATMENLQYRRLVADLAVELRLPSVCFYRGNVEAGLLMGYTIDMIELYRGSAGYIDRIIKGANPSEMPVQQPTKYELIINLRTAKALGVTLPPTLLARAHDVIE